MRSKSGIHRLILALEERNFIRQLPNRAHAIEVLLRLPEISDGRRRIAQELSPSVIEGNLGRVRPPCAASAPRRRPLGQQCR